MLHLNNITLTGKVKNPYYTKYLWYSLKLTFHHTTLQLEPQFIDRFIESKVIKSSLESLDIIALTESLVKFINSDYLKEIELKVYNDYIDNTQISRYHGLIPNEIKTILEEFRASD